MIEVLLFVLLGILVGIISGLTPGIHLNLIALVAVNFSYIILRYTSLESLIAFIFAMAITHTILDNLPSIYLGAPEESSALIVLPGHKMLLKGFGHQAVILTLIGSFFALILSVILIPVLIPLVSVVYPITKDYIGYLLIIVMLFMILKDRNRFWNLVIFILAGTLGIITLNLPNVKDVLFPLLTGLFGFSILLVSLKDKTTIPEQDFNKEIKVESSKSIKSIVGATIVGFIASFLPGLGSSQAAILAQQFLRKIGDKGFLILVGGINTVNMALSLVTLYKLDKARNGAVVSMSEIIETFTLQHLLICIAASLIAGGIALIIALNLSKVFSRLITKVNYQILIISIMVFVTLLIFYFCGFMGLLILVVSTAVGLTASFKGIGKNHLMGCLILPVILYFVP